MLTQPRRVFCIRMKLGCLCDDVDAGELSCCFVLWRLFAGTRSVLMVCESPSAGCTSFLLCVFLWSSGPVFIARASEAVPFGCLCPSNVSVTLLHLGSVQK